MKAALMMAILLTACTSGGRRSAEDMAKESLPVFRADTTGQFTVLIDRRTQSEEELRILRIAEAAAPTSDTPGDSLTAGRSSGIEWWYDDFDGIRLAQAITADAVRYYQNLLDRLASGKPPIDGGITMKSAAFRYSATVTRVDRFEYRGRQLEDVYVVRMSLSWSNYCGPLCALGFGKDRTVLVSPTGEVLGVTGDGRSAVLVS